MSHASAHTLDAYHSSASLLLPPPSRRLVYTERMCWCGYRRPHTSHGCCHSSPSSSLPLPLPLSCPLLPASLPPRLPGLAAAAAADSSSRPLCCRSHLSTASSSRQSGAPKRSSPAAPTRLPSWKHSRPVQGLATGGHSGAAGYYSPRNQRPGMSPEMQLLVHCWCSKTHASPLTIHNHTHLAPAACASAGAACCAG